MRQFKDITGQRFGKLTALYPTEKRQGSNIIWKFRCDCGNLVDRTTSHIPVDAACSKCKPKGINLRKDYTGQRFGRLIALECTGKHKGKELLWLLQCDCGNKIELAVSQFVGGNTKSCGCLKREQCCKNNSNIRSLIGNRYGMLTVVEEYPERKQGRTVWKCICDCGEAVFATTSELESGRKRSCGCKSVDLYCVYMHVSPKNLKYIGITKQKPWSKWTSGSKYANQYAIKHAIEEIGGYSSFLNEYKHYYYGQDEDWHEITRHMPFSETNLFSEEEAEKLRRDLIQENRTLDPHYGFNAASGGKTGFNYNESSKNRQSETKTGDRSDWKVYIHTNKTNGKVYIGITCRDSFVRWANGKGYRNYNSQGIPNSHFDRAIMHYGWDSFDHQIIGENLTLEQASAMEIELISKYESTNPEKGYNIAKGGKGSAGAKHTEETKERLRELAKERIAQSGIIPFKGKHHTEETKAELSKKMSEKYKDGNNPFAGRCHTQATKAQLSERFNQPVNQYTLDGVFIQQFPSGKKAAEAVGVTPSAISAALNGKSKQCAGFIWKKAED